jgi:hypothetical protein
LQLKKVEIKTYYAMTLDTGDAKVTFDQEAQIARFEGSMRLANMKEYEKLSDFLKNCTANISGSLKMDFRDLEFLNSSGITTISLFILGCKKINQFNIIIVGTSLISWQSKSLSNFQKLWSEIELIM